MSVVTAWFAKRTVKKFLPYVVGAAIAIVVLGVTYYLAYTSGRDAARFEYQQALIIERERIAEENAAALRFGREQVARLRQEMDIRDAEIDALREAAKQDPDAQRRALSADSVRRLKSIGGEASSPITAH